MPIGLAPISDITTIFSERWFRKSVQSSLNPALVYTGADATRNTQILYDPMVKVLEENLGESLIFYDHGGEDCLYDFKKNKLFTLKDAPLLATRPYVYTMACLSAKKLGKEVYKYGGTYWGAVEAIGFTTTGEEKFGEALSYGIVLRLQNPLLSWNDIILAVKGKFNEIIEKSEDAFDDIWLAKDRDMLHCYGPDAEDPPPIPWWQRLIDWIKGLLGIG